MVRLDANPFDLQANEHNDCFINTSFKNDSIDHNYNILLIRINFADQYPRYGQHAHGPREHYD